MTSAIPFQGNRLNPQSSTGPRSVEGKAVSRFNACKHGIDARSTVIPGEDPDQFASLAADYFDRLQPDGPVESFLVRTLVLSDWFVRRYDRIEAAIITAAGVDVAEQFQAAGKSNPLP